MVDIHHWKLLSTQRYLHKEENLPIMATFSWPIYIVYAATIEVSLYYHAFNVVLVPGPSSFHAINSHMSFDPPEKSGVKGHMWIHCTGERAWNQSYIQWLLNCISFLPCMYIHVSEMRVCTREIPHILITYVCTRCVTSHTLFYRQHYHVLSNSLTNTQEFTTMHSKHHELGDYYEARVRGSFIHTYNLVTLIVSSCSSHEYCMS